MEYLILAIVLVLAIAGIGGRPSVRSTTYRAARPLAAGRRAGGQGEAGWASGSRDVRWEGPWEG